MSLRHPKLYRAGMLVLFAAYIAVVAYLCFSSGETQMELPESILGFPFDKCVHFAMFLPFPILFTLAFDFRSWWRTLCIATLLGNVAAFCFERLQSILTVWRVTDPADLNANFLGVTTGLMISILIGLLRQAKN